MNLTEMTIEQLNAASDDLDGQMRELLTKKRALAHVRNRLLAEEHADQWGLTVEEYAEVKFKAQVEGVALTSALNQARAAKSKEARNAQTVTAQTTGVAGQAKR